MVLVCVSDITPRILTCLSKNPTLRSLMSSSNSFKKYEPENAVSTSPGNTGFTVFR